MTESDIWGYLRDGVMAVVSVLVFFWGRDRKQVADAIDQRFDSLKKECVAEMAAIRAAMFSGFELRDVRIAELVRRVDQASEELSKQSGRIIQKVGDLELAQGIMAQDIVRLQERGDRRKA